MKLKKFLVAGIGVASLALALPIGVVLAQDQTPATTNQQTQQSTLTEVDKQKLQQRLAERKAQAKLRLTNAQKNRLKTRCKNAQGVLTPIRSRMQGIETGRSNVYGGIVTKLKDLSTKLTNRNFDTTELSTAITTLEQAVTTFSTDLATYKQAISDLVDMDCASDPEAFKVSVDTARTARDKTVQDAKDIRTHVLEAIKPLLTAVRGQLAGTTAQENQ